MALEQNRAGDERDQQGDGADDPVRASEGTEELNSLSGSRVREAARATTKIATRPPTQIAEARAFTAISGTDPVALINLRPCGSRRR